MSLERRINRLEAYTPSRPRTVKEMTDDELVSILLGRPAKANELSDEELERRAKEVGIDTGKTNRSSGDTDTTW